MERLVATRHLIPIWYNGKGYVIIGNAVATRHLIPIWYNENADMYTTLALRLDI